MEERRMFSVSANGSQEHIVIPVWCLAPVIGYLYQAVWTMFGGGFDWSVATAQEAEHGHGTGKPKRYITFVLV